MTETALSKRSVAFGVALAIACVVNAFLVVVKEKSGAVMDGMKKMTGHHWITHSAIVIALFVGLGALFGLARSGRGWPLTGPRLIGIVLSGIGSAALIIIGFYLFVD